MLFLDFRTQIPEMAYILAILAVVTIFYGWFGVVIFANTDQGAASFQNLLEGVWYVQPWELLHWIWGSLVLTAFDIESVLQDTLDLRHHCELPRRYDAFLQWKQIAASFIFRKLHDHLLFLPNESYSCNYG